MSLNQTASDPRTINATGKEVGKNRDILGMLASTDLIAMPSRSQ